MNTAWICATCGTQFAPSPVAPAHCPICEDDRQYVGWQGQRWTTLDALAREHHAQIEDDAGLRSLSISGSFAIPQRALHLRTNAGNMDRRHATFMHSYPNFIPMQPSAVHRMRALLGGYEYEDVYGFSHGRNILGDGRAAIERSFERYFQAVAA